MGLAAPRAKGMYSPHAYIANPMDPPAPATVRLSMPYQIFVKDNPATDWREVKQLEDDDSGIADVDRLAASGQYHAVELRQFAAGHAPVYSWVQSESAVEHAA